MNINLKYLVFSQILLVSCVFSQSRTSASVEIRLKIVKILSAEISQENNSIISQPTNNNFTEKELNITREVIVGFSNNFENSAISKLENIENRISKINILDNISKLAQIEENQQISFEKSIKSDNLRLFYESDNKEIQPNFTPAVTIVY